MSRDEKRWELAQSRSEFEALTAGPVRRFYPLGDLDEDSKRLVEELGFDYAVRTQLCIARAASEQFRLPCFNVKN